jgi:hypothetical protein
VQSKLSEYEPLLVNRHAVIAAILDPRVKQILHSCGIVLEDAKELVIDAFKSNYQQR